MKGKVAIITGGARGIGKAIATAFVQNGVKVTVVSRTTTEVKETADQLTDEGFNVIGVAADISVSDGAEKVVSETLNAFAGVDILVNCAGIQTPIDLFKDVSIDDWITNIRINLVGTAICCKAVLPIMMDRHRGKIINFSGGGATSARPRFTAYACSKAAVVRFTETLAMEVKDYGIDVNAIAPGPVNTRMLREIAEAGDKAGKEELSKAKKVIAQGGTPPERAGELAVFLASEASNGITGRLISAVWDGWKDFDARIAQITDSSLYTLRRIDGRNFVEKQR